MLASQRCAMPDPRHILGSLAEDAAAAWLTSRGWTLLTRRYRSAAGSEVDLILLDPGGALVGVEVRARRSRRAGVPEETVDARHARRIGRSLVAFAIGSGLPHAAVRVDLVAAESVPERRGLLRLRRVPDIGS